MWDNLPTCFWLKFLVEFKDYGYDMFMCLFKSIFSPYEDHLL